jgi:hypothetical protein
MKKYINPILSLGTAAALLGAIYFQNQNVQKLKAENAKLQSEVEELRDEVFNEKAFGGRYELSLEHLKEVNPKAAKEFETYMENETE